jgi:hypothetical protein
VLPARPRVIVGLPLPGQTTEIQPLDRVRLNDSVDHFNAHAVLTDLAALAV